MRDGWWGGPMALQSQHAPENINHIAISKIAPPFLPCDLHAKFRWVRFQEPRQMILPLSKDSSGIPSRGVLPIMRIPS